MSKLLHFYFDEGFPHRNTKYNFIDKPLVYLTFLLILNSINDQARQPDHEKSDNSELSKLLLPSLNLSHVAKAIH